MRQRGIGRDAVAQEPKRETTGHEYGEDDDDADLRRRTGLWQVEPEVFRLVGMYFRCGAAHGISSVRGGRRRNKLYITGTKNSVVTVARLSPPITARPSGAFCSPPSPRPVAIGNMPKIIAKAVINTGLSRVIPAANAA